MKKLAYLITALLAFPFWVKGQSPDQNYTTSTVYQKEYTWAEVQGDIPLDEKIETVTYYDGLGRPIQNVAQRAGSNRENLITPVHYDAIGRKPLDYLPLPKVLNGNNEAGEFYAPNGPSITNELKTYYRNKFPDDFYLGSGAQPDYDNPYSEQVLEASPLSRVLEQGAPGYDWNAQYSDHTVKFGYETNGNNEVHHFSVDFGADKTDPLLQHEGYYPENELLRNVTKDENWLPASGNNHTLQEFTNKRGQTVLKRTFNAGQALDTYYVYDGLGNLTYVLSPEASAKIIVNGNLNPNWLDVVNDLGYQYKYDHRGRIFEKKIPGKGAETIIYDVLDRPILTQDANQQAKNQWLFTKYDALGRVAYTGILHNHSKTAVQSGINGLKLYESRVTNPVYIGGTPVYYDNQAFPQTDMEVHTIAYYDTYVDTGSLGNPPAQNIFGTPVTTKTKGLPTVSKVRVLDGVDGPTPSQYWITSLTAYDAKARPIYVKTANPYLGSTDRVESNLDFTGKPLESLTVHSKSGHATIAIRDYFTYDHIGRLKSHKQKVGDGEVELIAHNTYDDLGQLIQKGVGGTTIVDGYTDLTHVEVDTDGAIENAYPGGPDLWKWPSLAKTQGAIPSGFDGGMDVVVDQSNRYARFGFIKTTNGTQTNKYLNYGFEVNNNSQSPTVRMVVNNAYYGSPAPYRTGDLFRVQRVGNLMKFYKGNTLLGSKTLSQTEQDAALVGKVSFNGTVGGSVSSISLFGPLLDNRLQRVDYAYNVRGWLTNINDIETPNVGFKGINKYNDLFHFRINYNKVEGTGNATPLYNGNIAQTFWKSDNTDKKLRGYSYAYDALNRLTGATGQKGTTLATMAGYDFHDVGNISYDRNSNLQSLDRRGTQVDYNAPGYWDKLTYQYLGNQLQNVADGSTDTAYKDFGFKDGNKEAVTGLDDYLYDDNGNMVLDRNKGVGTVAYNHLDLPTRVSVDNGNGNAGTLDYVYDAVGTKLTKTFTPNGINPVVIVTQYAGGYIYKQHGSEANALQFFAHPEGYVEATPLPGNSNEETKSIKKYRKSTQQVTQSAFRYVYQYKDHLGNVRLSYVDSDGNGSIDPNKEIIEESHYYPFGLKQTGYNHNISSDANLTAQQWKYNGVELNEDLSLNLYEMEFRMYNPAIARFQGIDPVIHYSQGTSVAFDNNPIFWADPSGADGVPGQNASRALPMEVQRAYNTGSTTGLGSSFSMDLGGLPAKGINPQNKFRMGLMTGGQKPADWIRNQATGEYVWDGNVTSALNTPDGFDYVGKSTVDVTNHFKKNHPFASIFKDPKYGEDRTPWPGEILADPETFVDRWKKSDGLLANISYDLSNKFYVTLQIFNPLDDQLTFLDGEGFYGNGAEYVAEVFGTVITVGGGSSLRYSTQALKTATLQTPVRQQAFSLFSGRFRLERGVEGVNKYIQRTNGIKLDGAIQKPWHFVIGRREIPLNPLNPLWRLFPRK